MLKMRSDTWVGLGRDLCLIGFADSEGIAFFRRRKTTCGQQARRAWAGCWARAQLSASQGQSQGPEPEARMHFYSIRKLLEINIEKRTSLDPIA